MNYNSVQYRLKAMKRFFAKTELSENGCVEWIGSVAGKGYGCFCYKGEKIRAHRISYIWANSLKEIPKGLFVCHTCDNPSCVNPEHLWLGTNSDNMKDCVAKGRHNQTRKTHCPNGHEYTLENISNRRRKERMRRKGLL